MRVQTWRGLLAAPVLCAMLAATACANVAAQGILGPGSASRAAYERGYRDGLQHGEQDARRGRAFDYARVAAYRSGVAGYDRRVGSRDAYRNEFRRGFASGYRTGYERVRRASSIQTARNDRQDVLARRLPGAYREPAFARGYADGYEKGLGDGRDRRRYDPVGHRAYRQGDPGYSRSYGSRDAYKTNYRAGFRQGYEEGYRGNTRDRR